MTPKAKLMIGALAVVAATGILVGSNFTNSLAYMRLPSELPKLTQDDLKKRMRLGGVVMPKSIVKHKGSQLKEFVLFERGVGVRVKFEGILPDLFQENKPAVVEGYLDGDVLVADNVLAKHDENYVPKEMGTKGRMPPKEAMVAPALGPETEGLIFKGGRKTQ